MPKAERINTSMDDEMRARVEAWRAAHYEKNGAIPTQADAVRILIHRGLVADGFPLKKS